MTGIMYAREDVEQKVTTNEAIETGEDESSGSKRDLHACSALPRISWRAHHRLILLAAAPHPFRR